MSSSHEEDEVEVCGEQDRLLSLAPPTNVAECEVIEVREDEFRRNMHVDMQSPLRTVTDVLREAESIITEGTAPSRADPSEGGERVLIDEVAVQYSPRKAASHLPIEIVVRHNTVVSHQSDSDSDDEGTTLRRVGGGGQMSTITEGMQSSLSPMSVVPVLADGVGVGKQKSFRKGHRRAWSMPNAGRGEQMTVAVQHDQQNGPDATHHRRIVKYRLHPLKQQRPAVGRVAAIGGGGGGAVDHDHAATVMFEEMHLPNPEDDDHELEVEINEEEITYPPEDGKRGARTVVKRFWEARWKAQNFELLPEWLQDNEYLRTGHRPPLPSFGSCFKSIFALHTETGNIWTHMYGCVLFIGVAAWFLLQPNDAITLREKLVFSSFFLGAVCCLGMSFAFHTVQCHSEEVGSLFSKLDYSGITLLIVGSFIPWIYYGFHCRPQPAIIYITMISVLGISALIVSLWDKFAQPAFRPLRAGVFVAMGLSSIFPALHFFITDGMALLFSEGSLHWMMIMGALYLIGAALYATRVPERFFPGKCDLWFQSHQLFHTFVVCAALLHFHGITEMAMRRLMQGSCPEQLLKRYGSETHASYLGALLGLEEPAGVESWTPADL